MTKHDASILQGKAISIAQRVRHDGAEVIRLATTDGRIFLISPTAVLDEVAPRVGRWKPAPEIQVNPESIALLTRVNNLPQPATQTVKKELTFTATHGGKTYTSRQEIEVEKVINAKEVNTARQVATAEVFRTLRSDLILAGKVAVDYDVSPEYGYEMLMRRWVQHFITVTPAEQTRNLLQLVLDRHKKRVHREVAQYAAERRAAMAVQHPQAGHTIDTRRFNSCKLAKAKINPFARAYASEWVMGQPGNMLNFPEFLAKGATKFLDHHPEARW